MGFGSDPYGSTPYGLGTPAVATPAGGKVLRDPFTGKRLGSRKIDPYTKDYVLDENGRILGMTNTQQLVLLAVSTQKGSAAMRSLGHELGEIKRITSNFVRRAEGTLRAAVQHIVNRRLIEVVGVQAEIIRPGVAFLRLQWRDLDTGEEEETLIGAPKPEPSGAGLPPGPAVLTASSASFVLTGNDADLHPSAHDMTAETGSFALTGNDAGLDVTMPADAATFTLTGNDATLTYTQADLSGMDLTGWWRADYAGSPWEGTASAGTSGSHDLEEATNAPAVGSAVNGYDPADFNGSSHRVNSTVVGGIGDFLSTAAGSVAVLFYADSASAGSDMAQYYLYPALVSDIGDGFFSLGITSDGTFVGSYNGSNFSGVQTATTTGAWHLAQVRWTSGADLELRIDSGSWSSTTRNVNMSGGGLRVGADYNATDFFDGRILEVITAQSSLSDTDFNNIKSYVNTRYGLSL